MKTIFFSILVLFLCQINELDAIVIYKEDPIFTVGTKWTYDFIPYSINPFKITHSYITFEVIDTMQFEGKLIYKISNNRPGTPELLMYQENEKIYFWEHSINDFQLTYDFNALDSYKTRYTNICGETTPIFDAEVIIDTLICCEYAENWGLRYVQHISIPYQEFNSNDSFKMEIIEFVGNKFGGLKFGLGTGLCDNFENGYIGKIRCFEKGDSNINVNFTGNQGSRITCDSTWVEIINNIDEIATVQLSIYPNPAINSISVFLPESFEVEKSEIFDFLGRKMKDKITELKNLDVSEFVNGFYVIKAKDKFGKTAIGKFVKGR